MRVSGLWEEIGVPGESPRSQAGMGQYRTKDLLVVRWNANHRTTLPPISRQKSQNSLLTVIQTGEKTENAHIGAFYLKNESAG